MTDRPRKRIPTAIETGVLTLSRRRCCVCFCLDGDLVAKSQGQIAHIDHNSSNSDFDNLAYLCLPHHDLYDSTRSQSKGFTVGELKYYRDKLYRTLGNHDLSAPNRLRLQEGQIRLSEAVVDDCERLGVTTSEVSGFIVQEANRHPMLFTDSFLSLPLVFRHNVVLISWDCAELRVERLLSRLEAYPLNDSWTACLAMYRKATLLSYRAKGYFAAHSESKQTISVYRALISKTHDFLGLLREKQGNAQEIYSDLDTLVDEAEFAFANGDDGKAIARLEAVLSTVHKLILNNAPQGGSSPSTNIDPPQIEIPEANERSILIVDDEKATLYHLQQLLGKENYAVTIANTTTDALRTLVEHEFDLVITDIVMFSEDGRSGVDGREIVMAAKKSSPKTKVIVVTGFTEMSRLADLFNAGADDVIGKGEMLNEDFMARIRRHLQRSAS